MLPLELYKASNCVYGPDFAWKAYSAFLCPVAGFGGERGIEKVGKEIERVTQQAQADVDALSSRRLYGRS